MTSIMEIKRQKRRDKIAALRQKGETIDRIAERLGASRSTVVNDLRALGLSQDVSGRVRVDWDDETIQTLVSMYGRGATYGKIAEAIGCTEGAVSNRARKLRDAGVIEERPKVAHNKGTSRDVIEKHRKVLEQMMAIEGWESMPRKVLAAALKMPVNDFISIRSRMLRRGLVPPKSQGKKPAGKDRKVTAPSAGKTDKATNLWALALGRAQ